MNSDVSSCGIQFAGLAFSSMIDLLTNHASEIQRLCREFGVRKLEVFGSAARDDFSPERSDIDFVIEFEDTSPGLAKRFFELNERLEELLGTSVDFAFGPRFKNPYFQQAVDESRELVHESSPAIGQPACLTDPEGCGKS